jgi:transcription elongation factor Elf1
MRLCPYCHKQAAIPCASGFQSIDIGRFNCGHCGQEFWVMDDIPVIEDRPVGKKKLPEGMR